MCADPRGSARLIGTASCARRVARVESTRICLNPWYGVQRCHQMSHCWFFSCAHIVSHHERTPSGVTRVFVYTLVFAASQCRAWTERKSRMWRTRRPAARDVIRRRSLSTISRSHSYHYHHHLILPHPTCYVYRRNEAHSRRCARWRRVSACRGRQHAVPAAAARRRRRYRAELQARAGARFHPSTRRGGLMGVISGHRGQVRRAEGGAEGEDPPQARGCAARAREAHGRAAREGAERRPHSIPSSLTFSLTCAHTGRRQPVQEGGGGEGCRS
jgi:hypothetical protein